jgi:hypothetical protein
MPTAIVTTTTAAEMSLGRQYEQSTHRILIALMTSCDGQRMGLHDELKVCIAGAEPTWMWLQRM